MGGIIVSIFLLKKLMVDEVEQGGMHRLKPMLRGKPEEW